MAEGGGSRSLVESETPSSFDRRDLVETPALPTVEEDVEGTDEEIESILEGRVARGGDFVSIQTLDFSFDECEDGDTPPPDRRRIKGPSAALDVIDDESAPLRFANEGESEKLANLLRDRIRASRGTQYEIDADGEFKDCISDGDEDDLATFFEEEMKDLVKDRLLSDAQLKRLREHKYSATSVSLFDPLLQHWWNWLVLQIPIWLAPNLITTLGLIVNILTSLILIYYSPDCKQPAPGWACYLCALGLFVYQSLDAIDGKQARRTNSSSPLGELFDHGCDSISTVFVSLAVCVSCQLGTSPNLMFLQCFSAITLFYCAHWQTYVSGTLRFGLIDVTEAQMGIIMVHMVSGYYGCDFWTKSAIFSLPLGAIPTLMALPLGIWSLIKTLEIIFTGGVGKNGSTVALFDDVAVPRYCVYIAIALSGALRALVWDFKTILYGGAGKNGSSVAGTSVLSPVIPFSLVLVPALMIAGNSKEDLYEHYPALYILTFGLIAAKVTNRLVVAHMTKSEMDYLDTSLLGPFLLFMNQYFNYLISEKYLLFFSLAWTTIDLWRYSGRVCQEICESLDIYLFKIPIISEPSSSTSSRGQAVRVQSDRPANASTGSRKGSNRK